MKPSTAIQSAALLEYHEKRNSRNTTGTVSVTNTRPVVEKSAAMQLPWFSRVAIWYTSWFKYDRDYLCVNKSQFVPVIFEPPCIIELVQIYGLCVISWTILFIEM